MRICASCPTHSKRALDDDSDDEMDSGADGVDKAAGDQQVRDAPRCCSAH